jgi:NhaP-type Na+/H+ or K+/H+ antiporter
LSVHPTLGAAITGSSGAFNDAVTVFGVLLMIGALIAGLAKRSFLSLTAFFVLAGFVLGDGGLEVIHVDAQSDFVSSLASVALVLILFRDGLEVEAEMLQRAWHLPLRKLVLAMPITGTLVALATHALTDLTWTESFLVGALLSPTDPVLSSSVVTNPRVPRLIRHSLNLESGLNDGLALPAVLAFALALDPSQSDFVWWRFVLEDVSIGLAVGLVVGYLASVLMPRTLALGSEVSPHQKAMFAIGVAFAAYGIAVIPDSGNGLIATFVCAIVLGIRRPDIRASFETRSEDVIELVKLGIFVVFGSLLTLDGLFGDGPAGLAIAAFTLLIARPVAVFLSLMGTRTDFAERAFMGWFGPKGVATMTFSLLVLSQGIAAGDRIFDIASLTVLISIVAHGVTDHAGAEWIAERSAANGALRTPSPAGTTSAGSST